jgi:hypothetical protein
MGIRVRSPQGGMFKVVGNWTGETIGQDYAGRGRLLVWLEPDDAMARVEPDDAPMDHGEAIAAIAAKRQNISPPPLPALPKGD